MSNLTELPDLLPCPFCGSTNLSIETNSVQPDDFHDAWVNCGECNADGRHAMTLEGWLPTKAEAKEEAVVAWNRRAQPEGEAPQAKPEAIQSIEDCPEDDQQWAKVDPAVAFHLIERHAEDWADAGRLMLQWHNAMSRAAQLDGGQEGSE